MASDAAGQLPMLALALALAMTGIVASLALDRLAKPGGAGVCRPAPASAIHAGLFLCIWSLLWLSSRRPGFALALTLAGQYLVVTISNAKFRALREPFVFSDFGLFSQAFRFPRLYLPFLGVARASAAGLGLAAAVGIGLLLENALAGGTHSVGGHAWLRACPAADRLAPGLSPPTWTLSWTWPTSASFQAYGSIGVQRGRRSRCRQSEPGWSRCRPLALVSVTQSCRTW